MLKNAKQNAYPGVEWKPKQDEVARARKAKANQERIMQLRKRKLSSWRKTVMDSPDE